jgi:hypothetical protein
MVKATMARGSQRETPAEVRGVSHPAMNPSCLDSIAHMLRSGACMTITKAVLASLAVSVLTLAYNGDGFAEKFSALPEAVRATAEAHMDKAFPVSISSAKGEQGWDYQINTRLDGKYHDLVIDEKGGLVAVKDEMDLGSIPAAARSGIENAATGSKILTVEKVTEGAQVSYGATMKGGNQGTSVQVRVAPDGTLKSKK